jgi:hypothetical protein
MVERNRRKMDPLFPSVVAVFMQLLATVYVFFVTEKPQQAVVCGCITLLYIAAAYWLNRKPSPAKVDKRNK